MPGLLRQDAKCPKCGKDLLALIDTTTSRYVRREYHHSRNSLVCVRVFRGAPMMENARRERRMLEVSHG